MWQGPREIPGYPLTTYHKWIIVSLPQAYPLLSFHPFSLPLTPLLYTVHVYWGVQSTANQFLFALLYDSKWKPHFHNATAYMNEHIHSTQNSLHVFLQPHMELSPPEPTCGQHSTGMLPAGVVHVHNLSRFPTTCTTNTTPCMLSHCRPVTHHTLTCGCIETHLGWLGCNAYIHTADGACTGKWIGNWLATQSKNLHMQDLCTYLTHIHTCTCIKHSRVGSVHYHTGMYVHCTPDRHEDHQL